MSAKGYCLITGASVGIGAEFARIFAEKGHNLILVSRTKSKLDELATELQKKYPVQIRVISQDLSRNEDRLELAQTLINENTIIDVLINNAGFGLGGAFETQNPERQIEMIDLNISALTHLTRLFLPAMKERGQGSILNVASVAGFVPGPYMAIYYATKAYVLSFSEALASELEGTKIVVSALCPGPTKTEFQKVAGIENTKLFDSTAMGAKEVAEFGYEKLINGTKIAIPGMRNKFLVGALPFSPRFLITKIVKRLNYSRS
jgi:short-subunit dehydrogenase